MNPKAKAVLAHAAAITLSLCLASCSNGYKEGVAEADRLAGELDGRTIAVRQALAPVVDQARGILAAPDPKAAGLFPDREYRFYQETVYYNPKDDGDGAMYYTGFVPVRAPQKAKVKALENLVPAQKAIVESGPTGGLISQTYLVTDDSLLVFYPYSDLLSYIPPRRDMQSRGIWKKNLPESNPGRGPKWEPPYIDTAGKGYIVDVTCPIEVEGRMAAVAGADITLNALNKGFAARKDLKLFLVEPTNAQILAMSAAAELFFSVGNVEAFKYLRMIENSKLLSDPVLPDNLILTKTDSMPMKAIWEGLSAKKENFTVAVGKGQRRVHARTLPETGWILVFVE